MRVEEGGGEWERVEEGEGGWERVEESGRRDERPGRDESDESDG